MTSIPRVIRENEKQANKGRRLQKNGSRRPKDLMGVNRGTTVTEDHLDRQCAVCEKPLGADTVDGNGNLRFHAESKDAVIDLDVELCPHHRDTLFKHLKRAVPKRRFTLRERDDS